MPVVVKPVTVCVFQILPLPVQVIFPVPKAIVLVFALFELNCPIVKVKVFRVSVPVVKMNPDVVTLRIGLPDSDRLMSALLIVVEFAVAVAVTVTVAAVPEFASNVAVSAVVGALAPPAPPEVAAQFAVDELSQVPEPPTQNLLAMF